MQDENKWTYILYDKTEDLYKIGVSADPLKRFRSLCVVGEVWPVFLHGKNIEKELHKKFADARTTNKKTRFIGNGATEFFKRGGSFKAAAEKLDKKPPLPYISTSAMIKQYVEDDDLIFDTITTAFEFEADVFGYHKLGVALLKLLGVYSNKKHVSCIKNKVAVTEKLFNIIREKYIIVVSFAVGAPIELDGFRGVHLKLRKK